MRSASDAQAVSASVNFGGNFLAGCSPKPALGQEYIPLKLSPPRALREDMVASARLATRLRSCLKTVAVLILWLTVLHPEPAHAINTAKCEVDGRFGRTETTILRRACDAAVERLQSEQVRRKVYEAAKYALISDSVMSRSNIRNTPTDRWNLLNQQLLVLSLPNGANDTEPPFPDIFIEYAHAPESSGRGWLGRAQLNKVTVFWDGREWKQKGSFHIIINDYYVARGEFSDPDDWAGTIAHEMLHNLGHTHPSSGDSDWDKYQINVLDEIVQSYGYEYKGAPRKRFSTHTCGGTEVAVTSEAGEDGKENTTVNVQGRVRVTVNVKARVSVNGKPVN